MDQIRRTVQKLHLEMRGIPEPNTCVNCGGSDSSLFHLDVTSKHASGQHVHSPLHRNGGKRAMYPPVEACSGETFQEDHCDFIKDSNGRGVGTWQRRQRVS